MENVNSLVSVVAENKDHLISLIEETMKKNGCRCDLNFIDVSNITDMSRLFNKSDYDSSTTYKFDGNISQWDVSNVTNMCCMFRSSSFNGDISKWNVSKVTDLGQMFSRNEVFTGNISQWNVSNVTDMSQMFEDSAFNGDISR